MIKSMIPHAFDKNKTVQKFMFPESWLAVCTFEVFYLGAFWSGSEGFFDFWRINIQDN